MRQADNRQPNWQEDRPSRPPRRTPPPTRPQRPRGGREAYDRDEAVNDPRRMRERPHRSQGDNRYPPRPPQDYYGRPKMRPPMVAPKKPSLLKRVMSLFFTLLFYLVVIMTIFGAAIYNFSKDDDKSFFGYRIFTVLTNSMVSDDPELKGSFAAGDVIFVEMVKPEQLKEGDIITYKLRLQDVEKDRSTYLTHRLIEIQTSEDEDKETMYVTKGDANSASDKPIKGDQIVGRKVFHIPQLGNVMEFLQNNLLVSIGLLVALFALIVSVKYYFSLSEDPAPVPPRPRPRQPMY